MARFWTCQRVSCKVKCGHKNPAIKRNCLRCGKPRPARKRPAHRAVLANPYEWWVERFGNACNICGAPEPDDRRLDRDHDHVTGIARGLLCPFCNRALDSRVTQSYSRITPAWLRAAADYLERADELMPRQP